MDRWIWSFALISLFILVQVLGLSLAFGSKFGDGKQTDLISVESGPAFDTDILKWIQSSFAKDPEEQQISQMINSPDGYDFSTETQLSTTETLQKLGYQCETYDSISDDGYVTQLVRIINPHYVKNSASGDKRSSHLLGHLPTVVFYAGQRVSPGLFLVGSLRTSGDQSMPIAQGKNYGENYFGEPLSNRSLALTLANSGYDVWLVPARGVDQANRACAELKESAIGVGGKQSLLGDADHPESGHESRKHENQQAADQAHQLANYKQTGAGKRVQKRNLLALKAHPVEPVRSDCCHSNYWSFSSDEIIQFEFRHQLELVLRVSHQNKLSLVSYSNGGSIAFAFQASDEHCHFAKRHLDAHVALGPTVFVNKFNLILGASGLLSHLNPPNWSFVEDHIDALARGGFINLCKSKLVRYTVCKFLLDNYYGQSGQFQTFLDLNLLEHINRPSSARGIRQTLQTSYSGKMRKYDHGPILNLLTYGTLEPPEYQLSRVSLRRTLLVAGSSDAIVDSASIGQLRQHLGRGPEICLTVPGYNHLDLIVGRDVEHQINSKVVSYLNERQIQLNYYKEEDHNGGQLDGHHDATGHQQELEAGSGQTSGGGAGSGEGPNSAYAGSDALEESSGRGDGLDSGARAIGEAPTGGIQEEQQTISEAPQAAPSPSEAPLPPTAATTSSPAPTTRAQADEIRPAKVGVGQRRTQKGPATSSLPVTGKASIRQASVVSTPTPRAAPTRSNLAMLSSPSDELPKLVVASGSRRSRQQVHQPLESAKNTWQPRRSVADRDEEDAAETTSRMPTAARVGSRRLVVGEPEQVGFIHALS